MVYLRYKFVLYGSEICKTDMGELLMAASTQEKEDYGFAAPRGRVYESVLNLVGARRLLRCRG